jgi:superfamily I DNA/RNA helicase
MNNWILFKLQNNYRSDRFICSAANRLIEHNTQRIPKTTLAVSEAGGTVMVHRHANAGEELAWLANCITGQKPDSCAVLVRYNTQVDQITQYLSGLGFPVQKRETTAKPQDWRRCRNTLTLFSDPENNLAAYWFIRDNHGQDKAEKVLLGAKINSQSINSMALKIPEVIALADVPQLLARCNITLASIDLVQKGVTLLDADKTVADLIFALTEAEFHQDETGKGICVSTMHSAKGREWDIVFLPGFEQQTIPGNKMTAGIEEERRLAFVGMTRARHGLFMSYVEKRAPMFGPQTPVVVNPSQFISEAGL